MISLPRKRTCSSIYEQNIQIRTFFFESFPADSLHIGNPSRSQLHTGYKYPMPHFRVIQNYRYSIR